jgi:putative transposase
VVDHIGQLRAAFRKVRRAKPYVVDAIVLLPDHLHAILTLPVDDPDFPGRWRAIKTAFTRDVAKAGLPVGRNARGEYDIWQPRFWEHTVRNEADFERCASYIHFNPVKHGLVSLASEWKFSSLRHYIRARVLPADWGGDARSSGGQFEEPVG